MTNPLNPKVKRFEIALQIDTGNTIYAEFEDMEMLIEFIQHYSQDSEAILSRITPGRRKPDQESKP